MPAASASGGQKQTAATVLRGLHAQLPEGQLLGLFLGPIAGLVLWWLPLGLDPTMHKAFAIVGFMLVYWIAEPIDLGMTALMGCFLFWVLQVPPLQWLQRFRQPLALVHFWGPADGASRCAYRISQTRWGARPAPGRHLLQSAPARAHHAHVWAQLYHLLRQCPDCTLAPLVVGLITAFGLEPRSNVAKGLFVTLTYTSTIFSKMFISSNRAFWPRASSRSRRVSGCCGVSGSWPSCPSPS